MPASVPVLPGVDVLMRDRLDLLRGRRLGLVTNATGRSRDGRSTIDVLQAESSWRLVSLFSPEHGIRGEAEAGQSVGSFVDERTGLPTYSLYGNTHKPTPEQLQGLDALVFDIQDVGCRFYTYTSTLGLCLEAAAEAHLKFFVLDRVNPITGVTIDGPVLTEESFELLVGRSVESPEYEVGSRYGLGLLLTEVDGHPWIGHGGSTVGYTCATRVDTDEGFGAMVLTNGDTDTSPIVRYALTLLRADRAGAEPPPPPALPDEIRDGEPYAGTYSSDGGTIQVAAAGGGLAVAGDGGESMRLLRRDVDAPVLRRSCSQ